MTPEPDGAALRGIVEAYCAAFERGDVDACIGFFAEDAKLHFLFGTYEGREAIREWHEARFEAEVKLLRIEQVAVKGDTVVAQLVATSRRLRVFRMDEVKGTVTFKVSDGQFVDAVLSARKGMPSHLDWQFR
jgi:ketosteroid isomerase-like protein